MTVTPLWSLAALATCPLGSTGPALLPRPPGEGAGPGSSTLGPSPGGRCSDPGFLHSSLLLAGFFATSPPASPCFSAPQDHPCVITGWQSKGQVKCLQRPRRIRVCKSQTGIPEARPCHGPWGYAGRGQGNWAMNAYVVGRARLCPLGGRPAAWKAAAGQAAGSSDSRGSPGLQPGSILSGSFVPRPPWALEGAGAGSASPSAAYSPAFRSSAHALLSAPLA